MLCHFEDKPNAGSGRTLADGAFLDGESVVWQGIKVVIRQANGTGDSHHISAAYEVDLAVLIGRPRDLEAHSASS